MTEKEGEGEGTASFVPPLKVIIFFKEELPE